MDKKPDKIEYYYNTSNHYRVIHADGAFGGLTPTGLINMNIFSERRPLPEVSFHKITEGKLGEELLDLRVGKNGVIREVEAGVLIDIEKAEVLVKWLQDKINEIKKLKAKSKDNVGDENE